MGGFRNRAGVSGSRGHGQRSGQGHRGQGSVEGLGSYGPTRVVASAFTVTSGVGKSNSIRFVWLNKGDKNVTCHQIPPTLKCPQSNYNWLVLFKGQDIES